MILVGFSGSWLKRALSLILSLSLSYSMLVDRNLKRFLIVAASTIPLGFAAFPATAQSLTITCLRPETPVLRVDANTIICQNPNSTSINDLILYRYCYLKNQRLVSNIVSLIANAGNKREVNILAWEKCETSSDVRMTRFTLVGRKFDRWVQTPYSRSKPDSELMNRYRQDVTRLLDTLEKYPMQKPTF